MKALTEREPVMTAGAIVGAVMAVMAALVMLGVVNLDPEQLSAIETALLALLTLFLPIAGAWAARQQVTPMSDPRDDEGRRLVPEE